MRALTFLFTSLLLFCVDCSGQADSVRLNQSLGVHDGVFLSYQDFRHNRAISSADIVSEQNRDQLEFIAKTLGEAKFSFINNGATVSVDAKSVWGFFQNNTFYVNYLGDFYRVPVFGTISYFIASVKVNSPGFYDPRFGYSGGGTTYELREFLINYYDGSVMEYSLQALEQLLSADEELFKEYKQLGRKKQKEQSRRYLHRFNELHPAYSLK